MDTNNMAGAMMRSDDDGMDIASRADHTYSAPMTAARADHLHSSNTSTFSKIITDVSAQITKNRAMKLPNVASRLVQYEKEVFEVFGGAECFTVTRKSTGQGWSVSWSERLGLYTANYDSVTLTAKLRESIKLACHYLIAMDMRQEDRDAFFGHVNVCRLKRIRRS